MDSLGWQDNACFPLKQVGGVCVYSESWCQDQQEFLHNIMPRFSGTHVFSIETIPNNFTIHHFNPFCFQKIITVSCNYIMDNIVSKLIMI